MKRFKNILLVTAAEDGDIPNHVFRQATRLAKRNKAKLTILDVLHKTDLTPDLFPAELLKLTVENRRRSLSRLAKRCRETGVDVDTDLTVGRTFHEITRRVQSFGHDLVVTEGGRSAELRAWISGDTMHLMRKCPCAIWVVRPHPDERYKKVLAAIDPYPMDPTKESLNQTIMELAVSISALESSELHVIYAWRYFEAPIGEAQEMWELWEHNARHEIQNRLYEFLARYSTESTPHVHFVEGKPVPAISQFVQEKGIDLLVMGTVCRTGIRGFLIGNTAEGVLRRVGCSLLTVKPEGFVSPIRTQPAA